MSSVRVINMEIVEKLLFSLLADRYVPSLRDR
jgi:hypothetical protein